MAKDKSIYRCQACGYASPRWVGKCPDCGQWNTLVEEKSPSAKGRSNSRALGENKPVSLSEIQFDEGERNPSGMGEFDRVLGGGIVPGSLVLIGGDPGIGKSTLLLQVAAKIKGGVLYVSGEESPEQIKLRAERMNIKSASISILPEVSLGNILAYADKLRPGALIIDSIQTMYSDELESAPGSVGQVRECASRLMMFAKTGGVPVFLIGHVTKEGAIAGPRVLEHIVDTVLYFEGDRGHPYRILRTVKNRFGSTNEIGVFEMRDSGLVEISNASELFLSERHAGVAGSVVAASMEGTRTVLVEIQALVAPSGFGMPRRTSIGLDFQRVNLLIAVLEKLGGLSLAGMDVFTNVVGGLKLDEPATDLAVVLAIASSLKDRPINSDMFVFGELGLSGEVRAVAQAEMRIKEAARIGFKRVVIPKGNAARIAKGINGLEIIGADTLSEALEAAGLR